MAILVFCFHVVINTTNVDDDVVLLGGGPERLEVVGSRVELAATGLVDHCDVGASLVGSVVRTVEVWCNAVVVSLHLLGSVGPISHESNRHIAAKLHGQKSIVLEKNNALLSGSHCQLLCLFSVDILPADVAVRAVGSVEVSQANERCILADEREVQIGFFDEALLVRARQVGGVVSTAVVVCASSQSFCNNLLAGVVVSVWIINILDSTTIADDRLMVFSPIPMFTKYIIE